MKPFGHPDMTKHMMAGRAAAAKSMKTPAHLRQHQARMAAMPMSAMSQNDPEETNEPLGAEEVDPVYGGTGMAKPNKNAPVGQGGRFAAMVASGKSPALAAFIGRKKYGKKKMSSMAAAGRKKMPSNPLYG